VEIGACGIDVKNRKPNGINSKKAEYIGFIAVPYLKFRKEGLKSTFRY